MSFLWSSPNNKKLLTKNSNQEPSPTNQCKKLIRDSARNPGTLLGDTNSALPSGGFIEGTSLFASLFKGAHMMMVRQASRYQGTQRFRWVRAGMTVEASILLPLFLFFFMNLGSAIEMIRLHGNLQLALWQIGSKLAIYGYALDSGEMPDDEEQEGDEENRWWESLAGRVLASTYVKAQVIDAAGESYLDASPLTDGADGLQFWQSELPGEEDEIDLVVTYSVSPSSSLAGFFPFRMANRYYAHIWNGYRLPGESGEAQIVYIAETGTVYHLSRDCTYLRLSTRQIVSAGIEEARNQYGGRYQPCLRCAVGNMPPTVYITDEGTHYHYDGLCSGLRRTVYSVSMEEAVEEGRHACSRCGN